MGLVPDVGLKIRKDDSHINGIKFKIPTRKTQIKVRSECFQVCGPTLYNCLPKELRSLEGSMETYKTKLDKYLSILPDRPHLDEGSMLHSNELDAGIRQWIWSINGG